MFDQRASVSPLGTEADLHLQVLLPADTGRRMVLPDHTANGEGTVPVGLASFGREVPDATEGRPRLAPFRPAWPDDGALTAQQGPPKKVLQSRHYLANVRCQ